MIGDRRILVTGASGKQGGAVVKHLLLNGFLVRAFVRDSASSPAQRLAKRGVEIAQGEFDNIESIERAMDGVYGIFSVQTFSESDFELEIRHGKAMANVAKAFCIQHFVYSSVGSANQKTGIPHFDSKAKIETYIREIDLPYTILRPVLLMENWEMFGREAILGGTLVQPLDPDKPLQQVSVDDVGAFAALSLQHPEAWLGRSIDIAGDELTMLQTAEIFTRVIGRSVNYIQLPWEQFQQGAGDEMTIMYRWFNNVGYSADVSARRRDHPLLITLEQYLRKNHWAGPITKP